MFASKNGIGLIPLWTAWAWVIGFTITLTVMGTIREILSAGTLMSGLDGLFPSRLRALPFRFCPITRSLHHDDQRSRRLLCLRRA
ncbi:MAG: hypothetical protein ACLTR8_03540 [Oscillospiraceae bacterium]